MNNDLYLAGIAKSLEDIGSSLDNLIDVSENLERIEDRIADLDHTLELLTDKITELRDDN